MNARFVVDGEQRLRNCAEFKARLHELRLSIRTRHAAELAQAGFFERMLIRCRMAAELREEKARIKPTSQALYISKIADTASPIRLSHRAERQ